MIEKFLRAGWRTMVLNLLLIEGRKSTDNEEI
jgi:hypothetical protein